MSVFVDYARDIWGYFDISYCLPVLLFLRSMHVLQQYACLVFVVDHTRCMVFDYGKLIQQKELYILYHPFIISIYYGPTFTTTVSIVSKRLISLLFLFSSVFCILNFVLLGEPRAKMFIIYMLPYYIEVFYYV